MNWYFYSIHLLKAQDSCIILVLQLELPDLENYFQFWLVLD